MSAPLRLVIFDVDGTLVDSQNDIWAAMRLAYSTQNQPAPSRAAVLDIVGLSLPVAFAHLSPDLNDAERDALVDSYKSAYADLRRRNGPLGSPLYPGAKEVLLELNQQPETLLAVATGKSRRGLNSLIEVHGLERIFVSTQVADDHPSKPNPSMILACLEDTGTDPMNAVMIGDTRFDMDMARAAGVRCIGVSWGYHPPQGLDADALIEDFAQLPEAIATVLDPVT